MDSTGGESAGRDEDAFGWEGGGIYLGNLGDLLNAQNGNVSKLLSAFYKKN